MSTNIKNIVQNILPTSAHDTLRRLYFWARSLAYSGEKYHCACCERTFRTFLPYSTRTTALCPGCGSLERHRLFWHYFQNHTNLFTNPQRVLHFAPEYIFRNNLRAQPHLEYITIDLFMPEVDLQMDITDLLFKDEIFDVIICSHVLEHIPDDGKAMQELYRVLKPDGWSLMQVPLDASLAETFEDPSVTSPEDRRRLFGQDDHVRQYGRDFVERLTLAGFSVDIYNADVDFSPDEAVRNGLRSEVAITEDIFICTKKD